MQQYALSYIIVEGEMFPAIYSDVFEKLLTRMIAYVVFFFRMIAYVLKIAS